MAKPEIRAVKKAPDKVKDSSSQQQAESSPSTSEPAATSETESPSAEPQKPNQQQNQQVNQNQETATHFFQAVGVIEGEVFFNEQGQAKVTLSGKTYPLLYIPGQKYKLLALQKYINRTGNAVKRLIVYPKAIHFPDKNKPQQIQFQLLKFEQGETRFGISQQLDNMEFQLAGLWQFIPVCRLPCISVFKNATPQRLEWIKQADAAKRVKFMKPAHLPVLWKQAPVKPFKYNPKAEEQEKPAFVKIKAKFLPSKDAFGFDSLLEAPTTEDIPKYLKVSKKDKQLAQQPQTEQSKSHASDSNQNGSQPSKEQKTAEPESSTDEAIYRIANQIENREEIAKWNQGKQAETITNQLIAHGLKEQGYTLPKNYISNWKHGRNLPNPTSKHYSAYRLWQLLMG